jgi:hypothetical protein
MRIFPKFFKACQGCYKNIICHAMQCILYKIYFYNVFHMYYNLICIFICTPICTKSYSCKKWVLHSLLLLVEA